MNFKDKIAQMKAAGVEVELPILVALSRTHEMTEEEMEDIRRSWVTSELIKSNPKMRKDRAESLYKEARKRYGL